VLKHAALGVNGLVADETVDASVGDRRAARTWLLTFLWAGATGRCLSRALPRPAVIRLPLVLGGLCRCRLFCLPPLSAGAEPELCRCLPLLPDSVGRTACQGHGRRLAAEPSVSRYPRHSPAHSPEVDRSGAGLRLQGASDGSGPGQIADSVKVVADRALAMGLEAWRIDSDPPRRFKCAFAVAWAWSLLLPWDFLTLRSYPMPAFETPGFSPNHGSAGMLGWRICVLRPTQVGPGMWRRQPDPGPGDSHGTLPGTVHTLERTLSDRLAAAQPSALCDR